MGAGRPVLNRPPAAVTSRPVVAVRTPAPMPGSLDQRQAQAGGHLNQSASSPSSSSSLVRQEQPGRPVASTPITRQPQANDGFRSFSSPSDGSGPTKTQPRVWEAQGTPEPERSAPAQTQSRSAQPAQQQPWSHPLAKPVAPVQQGNVSQQRDEEEKYSAWHQQKPAPASTTSSHSQQSSHAPAPSHSSPSKKGR